MLPSNVRMIPFSINKNTPFNDSEEIEAEEIEVTDSKHPLFGRKFAMRAANEPRQGRQYVFVVYRDHLLLRIPIDATNLALTRPTPITKLTFAAITELISLAEPYEAAWIAQHNISPKTSGDDSLQNARKPLSTNSRRSLPR